jgi:hypothetical protein
MLFSAKSVVGSVRDADVGGAAVRIGGMGSVVIVVVQWCECYGTLCRCHEMQMLWGFFLQICHGGAEIFPHDNVVTDQMMAVAQK